MASMSDFLPIYIGEIYNLFSSRDLEKLSLERAGLATMKSDAIRYYLQRWCLILFKVYYQYLRLKIMFKRISGEPNVEYYPKKASTAFENGGLVYADGSGAVQPADATSGDHIGVSLKKVTSNDDDYADNTKIPVDVPGPKDVFEVDVETGTFTTAMIGNRYYLVADGDAIDVSATSKQVVTIVGYKDSSTSLVKINALITEADVATT